MPVFARFEVSAPPERQIGSVTFSRDPRTDVVTVAARWLENGAASRRSALNSAPAGPSGWLRSSCMATTRTSPSDVAIIRRGADPIFAPFAR